jgi:predicted secreted protein
VPGTLEQHLQVVNFRSPFLDGGTNMKKAFSGILGFSIIAAMGACAHNSTKDVAANAGATAIRRMPAADNTTTEITHASANGDMIGFFEEVQMDGSGAYKTTFRILDMKADRYVVDKTMISSEEDAMDSATAEKQRKDILDMRSVKNPLASFRMREVALEPIVNFAKGKMDGEALTRQGSFTANGRNFDFQITTSLTGLDGINKYDKEECTARGGPLLYTLALNGKPIHQDSRIPRSRGCPYGYGVDKVYSYQGKLLFFIRYTNIGFEGSDYHTITVPVVNP